ADHFRPRCGRLAARCTGVAKAVPRRRTGGQGDRAGPQDPLRPRPRTAWRMKRQVAEISGRAAERRAELWLEGQGWQILVRRRKTRLGEIDIIARLGSLVAFIEVKWR